MLFYRVFPAWLRGIARGFAEAGGTAARITFCVGLVAQDSDIAWHYDRDHLYGHHLASNYNLPPNRGGNTTTTFIDESQHFMVWMRPSVHSDVRKLYGVINTDIPAGEGLLLSTRACSISGVASGGRAGGCSQLEPAAAGAGVCVAGVADVQLTAGLGAQAGVAMEHSTTTC